MEDIGQWSGPVLTIAVIAFIGAVLKIGEWKGNVDSDRTSFKEFMEEVRKDIKNILKRLPVTTGADSPLSLTDIGERVSKQLKAIAWADRVSKKLEERCAGKEAYQIHEFCFEYVYNEFAPDDEQEREIKMCAYENGIDRRAVLDVLAVELRDKLLEQD